MNDEQQRVAEIIKSTKVAMFTQLDEQGRLVSQPMATQDTEFDGTIYFIGERNSEKVRNIAAQPQVNLGYSGNGKWASVSGTARAVDDVAKLKELWNTFADSWLEGGPDNPNNILIEVQPETAEYWDAPGGSKIVSLANLVKAKLTGERIEGDNETVQF